MSEPWVCFEDEHLLVVHKPAGVTTHRADTHAQDGMYEWVQRQRPGVSLSVLHRLDKATSGILLFGKTPLANRSVAAQLEARSVIKRYELLVERDADRVAALRCEEPIARRTQGRRTDLDASTDFTRAASGALIERYDARPHTGRTHQVRLHAAALGMPVVGDDEHGGADAARLFLHAAGLRLEHPVAGPLDLSAARPASFDAVLASGAPDAAASASVAALVALEARSMLFDPADTNAYLWVDRNHDGFPTTRVERLGDVALVLRYSEGEDGLPVEWIDALQGTEGIRSVYDQVRPRSGGGLARLVAGDATPRFEVTELGCRYLIDLEASPTSTGLFLDQRETRRELLCSDLRGGSVLNTFSHTGSLTVAAAKAGAETLSLDLSKRYLEWGKENLRLNGVDPADHDVIYGDAVEWMDRLAGKGRTFDLVLVDPPSTSTGRSRGSKRWAVERDLHDLVQRAARLCAPDGTIFVSTNLQRMSWARFLEQIERGLHDAGREGTLDPRTLPLDHRSGPGDPPYLKAAWVNLDVA